LKIITYHEALKYKATSFLPPNADAVGTPDVFGFVNNFGPKRSVLQLADVAAMIYYDVSRLMTAHHMNFAPAKIRNN